MQKILQGLVLLLMLQALAGCSATMTRSWDDDMSQVARQRGGTLTYLNQGAGFVIAKRQEDAREQAKNFCGQRPVYFLGETSTTSTSQGSMPVTSTSQTNGTVSNGYQTANYSGTTTTTTYEPVTYTWNHNHATFVCADSDISQASYAIYPMKDSAPVCREMNAAFEPGDQRLSSLERSPENDDCVEKEGWLRFADKNGKHHLFVGSKGKDLCKKLEDDLVQAQVHSEDVNLYLRKRLTCGQGTMAH